MFLSISTSSSFASVSLFDVNGKAMNTIADETKNTQSKNIANFLKDILKDINKKEISNIFVDIGPGSFTGIRTGIAVGIGLSVFGPKISGISALDAINYRYNKNKSASIVIIPTIQNEYYFGLFNDKIKPIITGCDNLSNIENIQKKHNAEIINNSIVNSELIGLCGIEMAKHNVFENILPIYIKEPNIGK